MVGSAHVDHEGGGAAGEAVGADGAGGGTGQEGFHWPGLGVGQRHNGAVAADDGDGGRDAALGNASVDGGEQPVDVRDEPGVEDGGGGAADGVERATDSSACDDGAVGQFGDDLGGPNLVLGVADGEVAGDGEGVDLVTPALDGAAQGVFVEGGAFLAEDVVAARDEFQGGGVDAVSKAVAAEQVLVVADEEGADAAAEAFDGGVGGEGGGEGYEADLVGSDAAQSVDGGGYAGGEVGVGGGGFVPGDDAAGGGVERDGVGVGAAGVNAEDECHGVMVARIGGLRT